MTTWSLLWSLQAMIGPTDAIETCVKAEKAIEFKLLRTRNVENAGEEAKASYSELARRCGSEGRGEWCRKARNDLRLIGSFDENVAGLAMTPTLVWCFVFLP